MGKLIGQVRQVLVQGLDQIYAVRAGLGRVEHRPSPCPPRDNHEPDELWVPNPHPYNEFSLSTTVLF